MSADVRPIQFGDRFESKDWRDRGRVVEVIGIITLGRRRSFRIETEAHPKNPDAVGHVSSIKERTLRRRFRRVSR